ncbi:hypothetical protein HUU05_29035, partial [candidate division KSB1 bacterium]|nr:hypothetical protein [candidate division KSB1 bacterium]
MEKLLQDNSIGFALLDENLHLLHFSELFVLFATPGRRPQPGQLVTDCYLEVFGLEEELSKLSKTPAASLMLSCIHRTLLESGTHYLDFKFVALPPHTHEQPKLLFTVSDET